MRYTILGFKQSELTKYDLSMNEVLLLDYIYSAIASPRMNHVYQNDCYYVWLNHSKILEDLPILGISNDRLKRVLKHLCDVGLLTTYVEHHVGAGSKTYYAITSACEDMRYSNTEVLKTTLQDTDRSVENNTSRGVENNTSYNQLKRDKELNKKSNSKELLRNSDSDSSFLGSVSKTEKKEKPKKKSLYEKCLEEIDNYTDNEELKDLLVQYLKVRLEIAKEKPLYANMWKGMIKKLTLIDNNDIDTAKEIIQQSIERGYLAFYPVTKYKNKYSDVSLHDRLNESGIENVPHITKEEEEELERRVQAGELYEY